MELRDYNLVINLPIIGRVVGNVTASGCLEIKASDSTVKNLKSLYSAVDGAYFKVVVKRQLP